MLDPLLQTKLYIPPVQPNLISRPHLIGRLEDGLRLHHKLTLLSAPAGFGKTTLLSEWVTAGQRPVAWLSLDEGENDPVRFLTYLIAALQVLQADVGDAALAALQSPQPPPMESVLTALINEMAAFPVPDDREGQGDSEACSYILVLDDYHLVTAQAIHDGITFLLDRLPPILHLVIAARADPPLPIARLRGQGQLTELRQSDLRFTTGEAAAFLNRRVGLNLSPTDVATLETRTEGWIAGLQMAAASMQGQEQESIADFIQAFAGSDRYILDYLVEEVFQRQPQSVQTFLLQTSILDRLTGSLCDTVWQGAEPLADSQATLEYLERNNLFVIPLDRERRWYRYHHLFADLLRHRLHQAHPDLVSSLHSRAGAWHEQHGTTAEAIHHALAAEDLEWAAHLVEQAVEATMLRSEFATLLHWVEALPEELVRVRPRLCVYHALALVFGGRPLDVAQSRLQEAIEADEDGTVAGEVAAFRALIAAYRGERTRSAELARQSLERLPEESLFFRSFVAGFLGLAHLYVGDVKTATQAFEEAVRVSEKTGNLNISVLARYHLADLAALRGRMAEARALYQQAMEAAIDDRGRQRPIAGVALIGLGRMETEQYDLEAAERYLTEGVERIERWGEVGAISGYTGLARLRQAQGDDMGAQEALQTAHRLAERFDAMEVDDISVALCQLRLWIAQGDLEAAARWVEGRDLTSAKDFDLARLYEEIRTTTSLYRFSEYTTLAWLRLAQGRPGDALRLLKPLRQAAEEGEWVAYEIDVLILEALAHEAQGESRPALDALDRALTLAEPGGFVRLFVEKGAPMARLLYRVADQGIAPAFTGRLLAAFSAPETAAPSRERDGDVIEPLSERETEVLQLIADGLSNREIAQKLFLSLSTIKVHTYNLYGKLGVHSRTQAVAKARALGILPPLA